MQLEEARRSFRVPLFSGCIINSLSFRARYFSCRWRMGSAIISGERECVISQWNVELKVCQVTIIWSTWTEKIFVSSANGAIAEFDYENCRICLRCEMIGIGFRAFHELNFFIILEIKDFLQRNSSNFQVHETIAIQFASYVHEKLQLIMSRNRNRAKVVEYCFILWNVY